MATEKRLIDANALDFTFPLTDDMSGMLKQIGIKMVKARIMEAPTVDAAPVVHARWLCHGRGIRECSHCKHGIREHMACVNHYCPNCGAKMDGGNPDGA